MRTLGTIVRAVACIGWTIDTLNSDYPSKALKNVEIYGQALEEALSAGESVVVNSSTTTSETINITR